MADLDLVEELHHSQRLTSLMVEAEAEVAQQEPMVVLEVVPRVMELGEMPAPLIAQNQVMQHFMVIRVVNQMDQVVEVEEVLEQQALMALMQHHQETRQPLVEQEYKSILSLDLPDLLLLLVLDTTGAAVVAVMMVVMNLAV